MNHIMRIYVAFHTDYSPNNLYLQKSVGGFQWSQLATALYMLPVLADITELSKLMSLILP